MVRGRVQGINSALNQIFSRYYKGCFSCRVQWKNDSGEKTLVVSTAHLLAAARWFEAGLIFQTLVDLKPFTPQMCSILYHHSEETGGNCNSLKSLAMGTENIETVKHTTWHCKGDNNKKM